MGMGTFSVRAEEEAPGVTTGDNMCPERGQMPVIGEPLVRLRGDRLSPALETESLSQPTRR